MRSRFLALVFCFLTTAPSIALSQTFDGGEHAVAMLLLNQSDADVRTAARVLYKTGFSNQDIFDLLAEITWTACSGNRRMDSDTLSWLGKSLGQTSQPRYAALLDYCLARTNDEKTKKHMKEARAKISDPSSSNVFEGGKIDLSKMRARLVAQRSATPRAQLVKKFSELRAGAEISAIYSALGSPDEVSGYSVPGGKIGHGFVKIQREHDALALVYSELGTVRFVFREGPKDWMLIAATSTRGLFWSTNEERFVDVDDYIVNGNGSQLREISVYLIEQGTLSRDLLDRIATRIHKSRQEQNDQVADGLAWLCKVIAKSGDGRYKPFLLDVSNTAASKKLKEYALKSAKGLPDVAADQYAPVSI